MKLSYFIYSLTLQSLTYAKRYIVLLNEQLTFQEDYEIEKLNVNILETFEIGDVSGIFIESNNFPYHLYKYDYISLIEEDHLVSIQTKQIPLINSLITKDFILINEQEEINRAYYLQNNPIWSLDRIDQKLNQLNSKYYYPTTSGSNVTAYIVDTGIDISHPEFENRATWGINYADSTNTDCNGHGTHVAGTVGSKTYGVAKKVNLVAVKILGCDGSGSNSGVIKGLQWVYNNKKGSSVINMSLGGPVSNALNQVIKQLTNAGIHVVVAAGNENSDACNTSPASEPSAMTVGATTKNNGFASFSNWGSCVDILSPGTEILSTYPGNKTAVLQGTSMATPAVVGVYSLILSENPNFTPDIMRKLITTRCTPNVISGIRGGTVNCLIYSIS